MNKKILLVSIIFIFSAIIFGAFGAHTLKNHLTEMKISSFEVGVRYQLFQGLGLMIIALNQDKTIELINPVIGRILQINDETIFLGQSYDSITKSYKHLKPLFSFVEEKIKKDPDQRNYIVSNEKIQATGFNTEFSLERGIGELIKGYTMIKNSLYGNI